MFLVFEIFRLFFNLLTPDDKRSPLVKTSVYRHQFKCNYIEIEKYLLNIFLRSPHLHKIANTLKKKMNLSGFLNHRLQKSRLLKCLKGLLSEHLWTVKMLKSPKDYLKLHGSLFVIISDHSEIKSN